MRSDSNILELNVDGRFLRDVPARILAQRKVDRSVEVLVAHNSREGGLFSDTRVQDDEGFRGYFSNLLPDLPPDKLDVLATEIYPLDFSGALPYRNHTERLMLAAGESIFDCHALATNLAYENNTRGYYFDMCPGIHAQDVSYSLYNEEETDIFGVSIDGDTAEQMQSWIVDFTIMGNRHGSKTRELPVYGPDARILHVKNRESTDAEFPIMKDPAANSRCRFWLEDVIY